MIYVCFRGFRQLQWLVDKFSGPRIPPVSTAYSIISFTKDDKSLLRIEKRNTMFGKSLFQFALFYFAFMLLEWKKISCLV